VRQWEGGRFYFFPTRHSNLLKKHLESLSKPRITIPTTENQVERLPAIFIFDGENAVKMPESEMQKIIDNFCDYDQVCLV
jgi:predicted alpha/beta superfamily hydrolase